MKCHSCKGDFAFSEMHKIERYVKEDYGLKDPLLCDECMERRLRITNRIVPNIKACETCRHAVDGKANNRVGSPCLWACRSLYQWGGKGKCI